MITVQLLESYCLPFMLYAAEIVSLSSANCRVLDNCINRALYRIFGPCDNMDCLRSCVGLDNVKVLSERNTPDLLMDRLVMHGILICF